MTSDSGTFLRRQRNSIMKRATVAQQHEIEPKSTSVDNHDPNNDLDVDITKAALATGDTAFDSQRWSEAESLLNEALRVLESLPMHRRSFCDILELHHKLAVCAYYTQDPAIAEKTLTSLSQQDVDCSAQQERMCEATHLLSQLYIRMQRIDLAKHECERTLQVRRRLLGKLSDPCYESMALMAHIHVLLDNRALAKTYLAMISEDKREDILLKLGSSLGITMNHLDFSSMMFVQTSGVTMREIKRTHSERSAQSGTALPAYQSLPGYMSSAAQSPAPSRSSIATSASSPICWQSTPGNALVTSSPHPNPARIFPITGISETSAAFDGINPQSDSTSIKCLAPTADEKQEHSPDRPDVPTKPLSRIDILNRIGCQPRDSIEEAVCKGDGTYLARLIEKKKGFWRGVLREHVRHERVTALHFAALFGEVEMARHLLLARYNVDEVPFGYSTRLTPLHFALGARQVEMVRFLIENGARPVAPDTWATLAIQPMTRSWILKTLSESEKDVIAERITTILGILLTAGWQINAPYGATAGTVLHQAVAIWTGSYRMDLGLRIKVTRFLCSMGADPWQKNNEGIAPWDLASEEGHHELLRTLSEGGSRLGRKAKQPIELPADS